MSDSKKRFYKEMQKALAAGTGERLQQRYGPKPPPAPEPKAAPPVDPLAGADDGTLDALTARQPVAKKPISIEIGRPEVLTRTGNMVEMPTWAKGMTDDQIDDLLHHANYIRPGDMLRPYGEVKKDFEQRKADKRAMVTQARDLWAMPDDIRERQITRLKGLIPSDLPVPEETEEE